MAAGSIPTAEVPLTSTVAGEIVAEKSLPIRVTALTDRDRSEAGAAGRERAACCASTSSAKWSWCRSCTRTKAGRAVAHDACAEKVLTLLEVPFRRVVLSSGDTGFGAARTYDLEVWLPGQQAWREINFILQLPRVSGAADERAVPLGGWQEGRASSTR